MSGPHRSLDDTGRRPLRPARPARARRRRRIAVTGAAVAGLLLPLVAAGPPAQAGDPPGELHRAFTEAAEEYRVPRSVLLAVSYLQTRWDTHGGAPSVSGGYGPMHLTDARTALARSGAAADGAPADPQRPAPRTPASGKVPARLRTLERAAKLTGLPAEELRTSPAANVRGGAALLADARRRSGRPAGGDPAGWFAAVASFPGGGANTSFAREVFDVLRSGERRTTDSGERLSLAPVPGLRGGTSGVRAAEPAASGSAAECPARLSCEWRPAPYEEYRDDEGNDTYGNHDRTRRPGAPGIDYLVIHDTEETWDRTLDLVDDPEYVSWHYSLRSSDGHVAQHVRARDVGWHSGNWYVNSTSLGLEHEGFLADPDAWFTEAMYRSSARLVRHLAGKYGIPLDRRHILGHDNVPGLQTSAVKDMHTDPGPYWDWDHYFRLLGAPRAEKGGGDGGLVTIRPRYESNRPSYTGCEKAGEPCAAHGSGAVRLHTGPSADAPLVADEGLHPGGGASTTDVQDTGARASSGQQYAPAGRQGAWTAVWYLGRKAWFHDPGGGRTSVPSSGKVLTPKPGKDGVPVFGGAYPEKSAYPEGVPAPELKPLPYRIGAGQRYAAGKKVPGTYLHAKDFDPQREKFRVVRGDREYYEVQIGHRLAFVRAGDVRVTSS